MRPSAESRPCSSRRSPSWRSMVDRPSLRAALLLLGLAACKPPWPRYGAPDGTFAVEFPGPIRLEGEQVEGNQRLLSVESRSAETQAFLVQRRRPNAGLRLNNE